MQFKIVGLLAALLLAGLLSLAGITTAQEDGPVCTPDADVRTGLQRGRMEHDGRDRRYLIYVPESYDPAAPAPLVLSFHGFSSNPSQQMEFSQWNPVADEHGFIVVYPRATGLPPGWNTGEINLAAALTRGDVDDLGFVDALLDELLADYCIDPDRIYGNGLSNGGGMSHYLACELADRIAAIGGVAGAYNTSDCTPSRPVPVMAFHGTADNIVPYEGGQGGGFALPPVEEWAADWAVRNGCDPTPEPLSQEGDASAVQYTGCDADATVILYTLDGGGHNWPGGGDQPEFIVGEVNRDVNASALMWEFFMAHPMP